MKKVVYASVGGRSFAFNEDAYSRLETYFSHFQARLNKDSQSAKDEVMSDLENRIAELFIQGTGGEVNRAVDLSLVEKTVGQLGMPDGSREPAGSSFYSSGAAGNSAGQQSTASSAGPDFSYSGAKGEGKHHLYRDSDNKSIGGVCSGLAAYLNIDTTIVRIIVLLAVICLGTGLLAYLVLWIAVPLARTPAEKCMLRGLEPTAENMARFTTTSR